MMFVTGLIRMKRIPYTQFSLKKELHDKLKRSVQMERMRKMGRKNKQVQSLSFLK
jgi:hypothetical protein